MNERNATSHSRRRGSVVVVVLVLVFFGAFLLTQLVDTGSVEMIIEMRRADTEHLRDDAYSALETTLAVLADFRAIDRRLYAPEQGWADPLAYAGYVPREGVNIDVEFQDESGKLSLPRLTRDQLVSLFFNLGTTESDADKLADALFAWMHEDYTPAHYDIDSSDYELAPIPYHVANRSPRSIQELRAVSVVRDFLFDEAGELTPLGQAFADSISLYNFNGSNVNAGVSTTLATIGLDDTQIDATNNYLLGLAGRAQGAPPYFRSGQELRSVVGNAQTRGLDTDIKVLRITITARQGAAVLRLSTVVCQPGAATLPGLAKIEDETKDQQQQTNPQPQTATRRTGTAATRNTETTSLNYPFTVLELTETAIAQPSPPPADVIPSA